MAYLAKCAGRKFSRAIRPNGLDVGSYGVTRVTGYRFYSVRERTIERKVFDAPVHPVLDVQSTYPPADEVNLLQEDTRTLLESKIPLRTLRELGGKLEGRAKEVWDKHVAALERKISLYSAVRV
jgi:hypothetical protein